MLRAPFEIFVELVASSSGRSRTPKASAGVVVVKAKITTERIDTRDMNFEQMVLVLSFCTTNNNMKLRKSEL